MRNNYVMCCHATLLLLTLEIQTAALCSTTSYEFEIDTKKQRQHRHNNTRLTESGNARGEQLLVVPTELLTDSEWLPWKLLSGSECLKALLVFTNEISDLF